MLNNLLTINLLNIFIQEVQLLKNGPLASTLFLNDLIQNGVGFSTHIYLLEMLSLGF